LLSRNIAITCLTFDYGQKHRIEIKKARELINYLRKNNFTISHQIIDLKSAFELYKSALTSEEIVVPEGHYEEEQMKQTVVPNRNAIFSSILYGAALSISNYDNCDVSISLGVHSGDHTIYPDCRIEFFDAIERAFSIGNWQTNRISFNLPYINFNKEKILQDALNSCTILGLEFDEVFRRTNTSYSPDKDGISNGKTGADIERILAFHSIGRVDPITYVEPWEDVLKHALKTAEEFTDS